MAKSKTKRRRPSRRARLMPDLTRSTIKFRSSSAIAPMMTTMARPSGPPVAVDQMESDESGRWKSPIGRF